MAYPDWNGWCGLLCWRQRKGWFCLHVLSRTWAFPYSSRFYQHPCQGSWQHNILPWWIVMDDADAKGDKTFSDFSLARPRKQNLMIDPETFSTPLLMFSLMCYRNKNRNPRSKSSYGPNSSYGYKSSYGPNFSRGSNSSYGSKSSYEHHRANTHWYASVLYKHFLTPFHEGIWNCCLVSDCDRGVLPTRPRNHWGYALLAHTLGKMRSCATGERSNTVIRTVVRKNSIIQEKWFRMYNCIF